MSTEDRYSVLVNSCDAFEDCWGPFFTLFYKYWPECSAAVFLNTEKKSWNLNDRLVQSTKVQGEDPGRLTWSECLLRALDKVETPIILYLQDDYFLQAKVMAVRVDQCIDYMARNPRISHIGLTKHGSHGPFLSTEENWLKEIRRNANYRVSLQVGLWRVDSLKSYLRAVENAWMFEIFGTWRAAKRDSVFLCVSSAVDKADPVFDYLHTGIIKGKWHPEVINQFAAHGLELDFSKRGLYKEPPWILRKYEVVIKLLEKPRYFIQQLAANIF